MSSKVKADLMLLLVTLCWGVSYVLADKCLTEMGPFTLNGYRFVGAFLIAFILSFKKLINVNWETIKYSLIVGSLLCLCYVGSTYGVMYTTLSNTGFLCALPVILIPFFERFIFKKKIPRKIILAALISLTGILFLTLKDDLSFNPKNFFGDFASFTCAVSYSFDLIITDKGLKKGKVNAYQLGVYQLLVSGLIMCFFAFLLEKPSISFSGQVWAALGFLSVFCTGLAFIVQSVAQQYTTASHVGIIFSLEPIFAGFTAFFLAGEVLTPKGYLGAVLMVSSLFIAEIDFSQFNSKKKNLSQKKE